MSEWQPIETAPPLGHRERIAVLVWNPKRKRWQADANAYRPLNAMKRANGEESKWVFDGWSSLPEPSFWMPLPAMPKN